MILSVNDKKSKRKKKHGTVRKLVKITLIFAVLVIPIVMAYNYIFVVKNIVAPDGVKVAADKVALGKSLFRVNKKSLLRELGGYPDFNIKITKMIPGKLVITKKEIEPQIYIADRNLYIDKSGNIFHVNGKVLYAPLKVFGNVKDSEIGDLLKISETGVFRSIRSRNGYYTGKIGNVRVSFTTLNNNLIGRIRLVMSEESRKYYTMDLRFKNQVIIR
ncbi:MAG: hypothetical protein GWP03_06205 [Proteobacteria bacterium]|nr:hypothetical protein [Pseudomonadota bacterium]